MQSRAIVGLEEAIESLFDKLLSKPTAHQEATGPGTVRSIAVPRS